MHAAVEKISSVEYILYPFFHIRNLFVQQHTLYDNINNTKKQNHCKRAHIYMRNVHIHPTQISVHFPTQRKEKIPLETM